MSEWHENFIYGKNMIFPIPPVPQALSPGSKLIIWRGRLPERVPHPLPLIEILPENHADITLNYQHQRGANLYNRRGLTRFSVLTGTHIDLYC